MSDLDFEVDVTDADGGMGFNFECCTTFLEVGGAADAKCINKRASLSLLALSLVALSLVDMLLDELYRVVDFRGLSLGSCAELSEELSSLLTTVTALGLASLPRLVVVWNKLGVDGAAEALIYAC